MQLLNRHVYVDNVNKETMLVHNFIFINDILSVFLSLFFSRIPFPDLYFDIHRITSISMEQRFYACVFT